MKKINLSNIVAGVRSLFAQKATFEHIQESYVESIASVMNALLVNAPGVTQMIGLVNSGSGLNYNISAGVVFYNNEVFEVPAFVGVASVGQVPVLSLQTTYRAGDPVIYSDNNSFNTHEVRKMVWSFGASGSGLCDFSDLLTIKSRINTNLLDIPGQLAALVASAPSTLDTLNELAAALANDPNFATTIATTLALKANKAQSGWTNLNLINSAVVISSSYFTPSYMIDEFGKVNLRGALWWSGSNPSSLSWCDNMPNPSKIVTVACHIVDNSGNDVAGVIELSAGYGYLLPPLTTYKRVFLDGISFYL